MEIDMNQLLNTAFKGNPAPRWIMSVRDLPLSRGIASYPIREGEKITLWKRDRQILDALIAGPLFCASTVRVSDSVLRLRRDHGLTIETLKTIEGRKYYQLQTPLTIVQVAA